MGEFASPKRSAMASLRLQSPTSPFFLGSNDDQLERAQARAARSAASRRKSASQPPPPMDQPDLLNREQISELFQNCIKLASENKINQKNTWELSLIDHLSEIIKVEVDEIAETNFQKASCTLEAGVKIYSLRVDSVHSEAYKVLGGINRAGREDDGEVIDSRDEANDEQEDAKSKKDLEKKVSPLSTLESSFEALNVKKFDAAFTVDPLYKQTSALFDEGGAKGLLLNNLGVYAGCRVLFDSLERPGNRSSSTEETEEEEVIDISFAKDCVEQMITHMLKKIDISPTLSDIVSRFNEANQRPSYLLDDQNVAAQSSSCHENQPELEDEVFDDHASHSFDDEGPADVDENTTFMDQNFSGSYEPDNANESCENEGASYVAHDFDAHGQLESVADFLYLGLGLSSKQNAWAGPDHWKYRKAKDSEQVSLSEGQSQMAAKKPKNAKKALSDIDFVRPNKRGAQEVFAPPKNKKTLLLPKSRRLCNTLLPEDCHYQPENLTKFFLPEDVLCLPKRKRKVNYENVDEDDVNDPVGSWDNENDQFDEGWGYNDGDDSNNLVSQPRQVKKIEVQYDKASKQVDVHALKETLWRSMQDSVEKLDIFQGREKSISFHQLLEEFPVDCTAAALTDISPHLCFICLLHLANEHSLAIHDCCSQDDLQIYFPTSLEQKLYM